MRPASAKKATSTTDDRLSALFIGLDIGWAAIVIRAVILHTRRTLAIVTASVATVPTVMARSAAGTPAAECPTQTMMAVPAEARR